MWRREERGTRLEKMVREGNRRTGILTSIDETKFICIAGLFLFVVVGGRKCKVRQYAANQRERSELSHLILQFINKSNPVWFSYQRQILIGKI